MDKANENVCESSSNQQQVVEWQDEIINSLDELIHVWNNRLGLDHSCGLKESETRVGTEIVSYIKNEIEDAHAYHDALVKSIDKYFKEISALANELEIRPETPPDSLGMVRRQKFYKHLLHDLRGEKDRRMKDVLNMIEIDVQICSELGESTHLISNTKIPTSSEFEALSRHVRDMETLKKERLASFVETKLLVNQHFHWLEKEPCNSFQFLVVCEDDSDFPLTSSNLEKLKLLFNELEENRVENERRVFELREKIVNLMCKLQLDNCPEFDEISEQMANDGGGGRNGLAISRSDCAPSLIKQLEQKLDELQIIKFDRLEEVTKCTRQELKNMWCKCLYDVDMKVNTFQPFLSNEFTEELLDLHEHEVERLKKYYEENRSIFELINRRQELWRRMLDLEALQKDPTHLLKAKGPVLLMEEKDRKRINKKLPQLDEELNLRIKAYSDVNDGQPFMIGNVPYEVFIENQVLQHESKITKERNYKAQAKHNRTEFESKFGSTTLHQQSKICTPSSASIINTNNNVSTKRKRGAAAANTALATTPCSRRGGGQGAAAKKTSSSTLLGVSKSSSQSSLDSISSSSLHTPAKKYLKREGTSSNLSSARLASTRNTPMRTTSSSKTRSAAATAARGGALANNNDFVDQVLASYDAEKKSKPREGQRDKQIARQKASKTNMKKENDVNCANVSSFNKEVQSIDYKNFFAPSLTSTLTEEQIKQSGGVMCFNANNDQQCTPDAFQPISKPTNSSLRRKRQMNLTPATSSLTPSVGYYSSSRGQGGMSTRSATLHSASNTSKSPATATTPMKLSTLRSRKRMPLII